MFLFFNLEKSLLKKKMIKYFFFLKNYILKILRIFEKTNDLKKGYVKISKIEKLTKRSQEETKKSLEKDLRQKSITNKQKSSKNKKGQNKSEDVPKTNNRLKKKKKKKEQPKKKNKTIYCQNLIAIVL